MSFVRPWSLGIDVAATDHSIMYTEGHIMFLWSCLGAAIFVEEVDRLLFVPLQIL